MFKSALTESAYLALTLHHHADNLYRNIESDRARLEEWLPWCQKITDEEGGRKFIERFLNKLAASDGLLLGIWVEDILAGGILLRSIDWSARRTEVGFWIVEKFSGQGLVTRATAALLNYAFDELKLEHCVLRAAVPNLASKRVAERLGFKLEGILRHTDAYAAGVLDHAFYGMLAEEWRAGEAKIKYSSAETI